MLTLLINEALFSVSLEQGSGKPVKREGELITGCTSSSPSCFWFATDIWFY